MMAPRSKKSWRWPLLVALVGLIVASVSIFQVVWLSGDLSPSPIDVLLSLVPLTWLFPGLLVLRRADWHPVGWLLVAVGLGYCFDFDLNTAAIVWDRFIPVSRPWAAWIADGWGNFTAFALTVALLTVFPDGLSNRGVRGRRWGWARIVLAATFILTISLVTTVGGREGNVFAESYPNPTGLGVIPGALADAMILPILAVIAASLVSLWRRSRSADEETHRQYKWVLFPFLGLFSLTPIALILVSFLGTYVWLPVVFMYFVIPVAFSVAMLRYRWFDIDRVVSRTVTYAIVAVVAVAVYAVPVVWLPDALGLSSDLTVAGATLAAAAVFSPSRRWVQTRVERRFNRARYDAEQVVAALSGHLQSAVDIETVTDELSGAATVALHPASVAVWMQDGARG